MEHHFHLSAVLTSCDRSNQDRVEFDDGAEGVLGVDDTGHVFAMKL